MKAVTKEEFFSHIGPKNCHPTLEGNYPYTSIFCTPCRREVGRIVETLEGGKYPPQKTYLLPQ